MMLHTLFDTAFFRYFCASELIQMLQASTFLKRIILLIIIASSLNLSVQATRPDIKQESKHSQSSFSEPDFFLLPFGERESNHNIQPPVSGAALQFSSVLNSVALLNQCQTGMELYHRQYSKTFRDYPFIVIVRKLRI